MFCKQCGHQIDDNSNFCPNCGCETTNLKGTEASRPAEKKRSNERDWLISLILCIFAGYFGVHSFYNGKTGVGIAQLLTCGGCGIWTLIDIIMICTDNYKDCDGKPLVHKI